MTATKLIINGEEQSISGEGNTKTFYLSSNTDLTTAQEAYDRWISGKEPIIYILNTSPYTNSGPLFVRSGTSKNATTVYFEGTTITKYDNSSTGKSGSYVMMCYFSISNGTVSSVYGPASSYKTSMFLATGVNYSTPYTPQYPGSPATKKYVDDSVSVVSGDSGVTYTIKVSNSDPTSGTASNIITLVP